MIAVKLRALLNWMEWSKKEVCGKMKMELFSLHMDVSLLFSVLREELTNIVLIRNALESAVV